jgi:uncharacterized protein
VYVDASALAKRYVDEVESARARELLASHSLATCRLSEVEVASALARRYREGALTRHDLDRALAALRVDIGSIALVELSAEVTQAALALLTRHPLRTGDAVQLASCLHLRRQLAGDVRLLSYDARLNDASRLEGISLVPAN